MNASQSDASMVAAIEDMHSVQVTHVAKATYKEYVVRSEQKAALPVYNSTHCTRKK